ncbi:ribosomal protection-like ABC-F family protein [Pleomorphovibrio marinus]|uniref:ribosomal protection-like ABC-F family protein n=1 Tax=Pleomorphovibrio marinus TaxID=2164132 RepID=UPI000E0AC485|nr:ABC-F family ATP-binding cassette domain-containing protein [Pleomorphovibrio marinus]
MLVLQNVSFALPNKDLLFAKLSLTVNPQDKIALIGNNGVGKSTLLKIIQGELSPTGGFLKVDTEPYFIPQIFGQYDHLTVAQALGVSNKIIALKEILEGKATEENFTLLAEDWTIEERCIEALKEWQLGGMMLRQKLERLSGGQKTKVFLAGISIHQPKLVLMDEPSNHLDTFGRQLLYEFVQSTSSTLLLVSHNRKLLNLMNQVAELSKGGITVYGGNYDFYLKQKEIARNALCHDIQENEKALRKAKEKEQETLERQQRRAYRGKKKQEKAGMPRIAMNQMRNNAEKSTAKFKNVHADKLGGISQELQELRAELPGMDKMKFGFDHSTLHKGKILFSAKAINFCYTTPFLWDENLNFQICSGERIAIKGLNGSGKTTLIKLILGDLEPQVGTVYRANNKSVYIDQHYSLIDTQLKVIEQAQQYNVSGLQEHEIKTRLSRFLFPKEFWDKPCSALSGGERMRLLLCCLTITCQSPDIIVLDEPTNNLDIQNSEILTSAINEYQGTLLVVSHDEYFLDQVNIERNIFC